MIASTGNITSITLILLIEILLTRVGFSRVAMLHSLLNQKLTSNRSAAGRLGP
jgi:hypothetical protein